MAINLLQAHGQLCYEPDLESNNSFIKNTLMVKRSFKNPKTGNYDFDYIPFVARGDKAKFITKKIHKLDYVYIVGRIVSTGNNNYYVELTDIDIEHEKKKGE